MTPGEDDQMVMMALQNLDRVSSNFSSAAAGTSDELVAGDSEDRADLASLVRGSLSDRRDPHCSDYWRLFS